MKGSVLGNNHVGTLPFLNTHTFLKGTHTFFGITTLLFEIKSIKKL